MWTLTLFRALSGVQNALYYAKLDMIAKLWANGDTGYWESRGYTEETIQKFGLGWCDKVPYNEKTWYLLH